MEQYKGCDIIDINPGACLWSQKIHEALQPRRHLLLEPEPGYFEPFIKPLLEQSDSKYRHTSLLPTHPIRYWSTYNQIFNGELLPERDHLEPGDPALRKINRTLLVTGNVHRLYRGSNVEKGISYPSCLTLGHMVVSSQVNEMYHSYGLVKMLLWAPAASRGVVLPQHLGSRGAFVATNDVLVDINEVIGAPEPQQETTKTWAVKRSGRPRVIEDIATLRAIDSMKAEGLEIPKNRVTQSDPDVEARRTDVEKFCKTLDLPLSKGTTYDLTTFKASLSKLEEDVERVIEAGPTTLKEMKAEPVSEEGRYLEEQFDGFSFPMQTRFAAFISHSLRLLKAERHYFTLSPTLGTDEKKTLMRRLSAVQVSIRSSLQYKGATGPSMWEPRATNILDELVGSFSDPPLLPSDRRTLEPLKADASEFWPVKPLMLLEIDPREKSFGTGVTSPNTATTLLRDFMSAVMAKRTSPVLESLDRVAPHAAEDILDKVEAITNPNEGGRLSPDELRTYSLSRTMLEELIEAWIAWPNRPSDEELRDISGVDWGGDSGGATLDKIYSDVD